MNTYTLIIRMGRLVEKYPELPKQEPYIIVEAVKRIEDNLLFTSLDEFLQVFPLRKRYKYDGYTWNYLSAREFFENEFGANFGKDTFTDILANDIFDNRYIKLLGKAYLTAVGEMYKKKHKSSMICDIHDM